jgi:hypothetical protein
MVHLPYVAMSSGKLEVLNQKQNMVKKKTIIPMYYVLLFSR